MINKKSIISGEVLWMIPQIFFLVAVLFAFVILVKGLILTEIDVKEIEANILINRILLSKGGISYYDEDIRRLYPGIIDLEKFYEISKKNQNVDPRSVLDEKIMTYGSDNPMIAAKITLEQDPSEEQDPGTGLPITRDNDINIYYNKKKFERWQPRDIPGIRGGAGSYRGFEKRMHVLVKDGESIYPTVLVFYVLI